MPEYTFAVLLALLLVIGLDLFVLRTRLIAQPRWWLMLGILVVLQTIVDNYLNGRWWLESYIVGPYPIEYFSGIRIIETPLENYGFGIAMIWLCVMIFEVLEKNKKV